MDIMTAIIYGLIQGISEFLPVSSSGHLALLPYLMAFPDPGVVFDLCMHVGTALAVIVYFRKRIQSLVMNLIPAFKDLRSTRPEQIFVRYFVLATAVSVGVILILKPYAHYARDPWVIAFNQAFFGILLWVADSWQRRHSRSTTSGEDFFSLPGHSRNTAFMGMAQALAIFPGVSRSGVTLTAAYFQGIDRTQAGAFSFLMSLPIILAGVLIEIPDLIKGTQAGGQNAEALLVGMGVSFVVGYATIHYFMKLISRVHLGWFTVYRLGLAAWLVFLLMR